MRFDENSNSPDRFVVPAKCTTKVNFAVVGGVLLFLILGTVALCFLARDQTDEPAGPLGVNESSTEGSGLSAFVG